MITHLLVVILLVHFTVIRLFLLFALLMVQEADYMAQTWRAKTIGPTLPSFYLDDDRLPFNKTLWFQPLQQQCVMPGLA
jgi:hypothetical protein